MFVAMQPAPPSPPMVATKAEVVFCSASRPQACENSGLVPARRKKRRCRRLTPEQKKRNMEKRAREARKRRRLRQK